MKKIFFIGCLFYQTILWAQQPIYSQYYAAPMQLNPAFAGLVEAPVIQLSYRNQWPNIPNAYQTFSAGYSQYFSKMNSSFGFRAEGDVAAGGLYSSVRLSGLYVYDIRFDKNSYIRVGFDASIVSQRLNWNKLVFLDQLDLVTGTSNAQGVPNSTQELAGTNSRTYLDFSPGFLVNTAYFFAGFSLRHLNAPNESLMGANGEGTDELPVGFSFQAGSQIKIGNSNNKRRASSFISPNLLWYKEGRSQQLNVGAYVKYQLFLGGIWFRHTFTNADAVILMVGIQKGMLKVAYSYDWTVSALGGSTGGAHEITLLFNFENEKAAYKNRYNDCLGLFR